MNPFVSVIFPVYNDHRICFVLDALINQTYPTDRYEVIIADNGSRSEILKIVESFCNRYPNKIKMTRELEKQSSYAARNKALSIALGEVLAFTDSDCVPVREWISNGINTLLKKNTDLVGGKITFTFSIDKEAAEIFDSISNMQIEENILNRRVAKTANLFVYRKVFESIGYFPSHLASGGDVLWTKKATDHGFKLVYSPDAEVFHPARKLNELMKKQYRVGWAQPMIWKVQRIPYFIRLLKLMHGFLPINTKRVVYHVCSSRDSHMQKNIFSIWIVSWLSGIATNLGRIHYMLYQFNARVKSK